jgi:putative MATE family efflux protein
MPRPAVNLLLDPPSRLVLAIAVPASVGYLFNTLFNIVDTWWAGRISTEAQAALGLSFPVFFAIVAVATGLATGVSALIANALGRGRPEEARQLAAQAVSFTVLVSVVLAVGGWFSAGPMFALLGATGEAGGLAGRYMRILFAGCVLFNLNHVFNAMLVARGDTRTYRDFLVAGVIVNTGLNPLLMFGAGGWPGLGFDGIAWATLLVQAGGTVHLYRAVRRVGALDRPKRAAWMPHLPTVREIVGQSGPATMNMTTIGLGILVLTWFVNRHGAGAVAAYGIATRIEQLALLPAIGLNMAVLAVVGQNHGAGQTERAWMAVRAALRYGTWLIAPGLVLMAGLAGPAMRFFTTDAEVVRIGVGYLRLAGFLLYAYVLLFTLTAALQGIKRPHYAVWIGLYRQIAAPLVVIPVLAALGLGLWSVWISVGLTTTTAALYTVWYTRRVFARLEAQGGSAGAAAS